MLAIIIPYYKIIFFEETLESLSKQTDKRFKVYIGDDASSENPIFLLEKYKGKFDFVYHRFETNLGSISLTKQWERCIALSENEGWIMILGDDDVFGENVVEGFYVNLNKIEENKINVIRYSSQKIYSDGSIISDIYQHPTIEKATDFFFRKSRSSLSEYIYRKVKVNEIGFKNFPLGWYSDILAVLEFSEFKNIYSINNAQIFIRISAYSISGNDFNLKLKAESTFEFYYYLLTNKVELFDEKQKKELCFVLCKCYLNDKKKLIYFFKASVSLLSNYLFKDFFNFIKLILVSLKNSVFFIIFF